MVMVNELTPAHRRISQSFVICNWAGMEVSKIINRKSILRCEMCEEVLNLQLKSRWES